MDFHHSGSVRDGRNHPAGAHPLRHPSADRYQDVGDCNNDCETVHCQTCVIIKKHAIRRHFPAAVSVFVIMDRTHRGRKAPLPFPIPLFRLLEKRFNSRRNHNVYIKVEAARRQKYKASLYLVGQRDPTTWQALERKFIKNFLIPLKWFHDGCKTCEKGTERVGIKGEKSCFCCLLRGLNCLKFY